MKTAKAAHIHNRGGAGADKVINREENFCVTGAVTKPTRHIT